MRILITVLFLVSFGSVSMAGVSDVYYCEITHSFREIMITGELKSKVDSIWGTMWAGGIANLLSVIE